MPEPCPECEGTTHHEDGCRGTPDPLRQQEAKIPTQIYQKLTEIAKARGLRMDQMIKEALKAYVEPQPWWATNARFRYLHPGNDFETETGLKIGERVKVITLSNEGSLEPGAVAKIETATWDAAQWYVHLEGDEDGAYTAWELSPIDREDGLAYH